MFSYLTFLCVYAGNQKTAAPFTPPQLIEGRIGLPRQKHRQSNAQRQLSFRDPNAMPDKGQLLYSLLMLYIGCAESCVC